MKKFLIPVDFSEASAQTLRFVFELNKYFFAQLEVIHLFDVPFAIGDESGQTINAYEDYKKNYEAQLWDFINANKGDYHFDINVQVTAGGHYQGIVDYAKKSKSSLIIIGNKGSGKLKRWSFGSVAKYLITHPQVPVLAIPTDFTNFNLKKILLTADLVIPLSTYHYKFLATFAERLGAEIDVINVREKFDPFFKVEESALALIEKNIGKKPVVLHKKEGQSVRETIHEYEKSHGIDLLVTIPHFHTWLDRFLIGSETAALAKKEEIPILSLPEKMQDLL